MAVSREDPRPAVPGGATPQSWGKRPSPLLTPAHPRARKAHGLAGVSNKQLYCVCPAGVRARAGVMGTAPLLLRREATCGLRGLAWRLCSLLTDFGPLPQSPLRPSPSSSQGKQNPESELTLQGARGGGSDLDSREVLQVTSAILVSSVLELSPARYLATPTWIQPMKIFQEVHQCK